jgi:hypothetical protein
MTGKRNLKQALVARSRNAPEPARFAAADLQRPWLAAPMMTRRSLASRGLWALLADTIMTRFVAVKHQRMMALAKDMNAAEDAIVKLLSIRIPSGDCGKSALPRNWD